jgi:hypothetical protein
MGLLNLISKTPMKVLEDISLNEYRTHCGMFTTPQSGYDIRAAVDIGVPWALDNGCYTGYEPKKILNQLYKWQGIPRCLFAALPDVVGDHTETYLLSMQWLDTYHRLDYPPAFVLQDGVTLRDVPYNEIAAVFVGGTNDFKNSDIVIKICKEARLRGLWIHCGRVGGLNRFRDSRDVLMAHSFDSTGFSKYPQKMIDERWIPQMQVRQHNFLEKILC